MKKKAAEKIDEDWMSTYGDMVTLLLCFFVMMLAASTPDAAKYEQIQAGLNEGVGKQENQPRPIEMMMVELSDDIQSMEAEDKVALGTDAQGIVLEFEGDTLFDYGSAEIKKKLCPHLNALPPPCSRKDITNSFLTLRAIPATNIFPARNTRPTGNFHPPAPHRLPVSGKPRHKPRQTAYGRLV